ncbi:MAG: GNAT family N-acetyltransferase [Actinomycetota bacterium]
MIVHDAAAADLDARTLYGILRLRSEVFVIEQDCVYLDPDGRDLQPGARQLWVEHGDQVVATLRVLEDPAGHRVGRVCVAASARSTGLAATLLRRAIELAGDRDVVLDAQSYLQQWYEQLGFVRSGAEFVEDGIPHVPMRRSASRPD